MAGQQPVSSQPAASQQTISRQSAVPSTWPVSLISAARHTRRLLRLGVPHLLATAEAHRGGVHVARSFAEALLRVIVCATWHDPTGDAQSVPLQIAAIVVHLAAGGGSCAIQGTARRLAELCLISPNHL